MCTTVDTHGAWMRVELVYTTKTTPFRPVSSVFVVGLQRHHSFFSARWPFVCPKVAKNPPKTRRECVRIFNGGKSIVINHCDAHLRVLASTLCTTCYLHAIHSRWMCLVPIRAMTNTILNCLHRNKCKIFSKKDLKLAAFLGFTLYFTSMY